MIMAQLAIKGCEFRGNEVIGVLEMIGGKNTDKYSGNTEKFCYYIDENGKIECETDEEIPFSCIYFTLEEFLEKFPYKVGDKVLLNGIVKTIKQARWDSIDNEVIYKIETNIRGFSEEYYVHYYDLQPYKKETETMEEVKIDIPNGYEFFDIGDDNQQVVLTKIQPQYPKNYEECFNICFGNKHHIVQVVGLDGLGDNKELFESFIKLKICRDAYWKIAGEQMGLGKPWEPDYDSGVNKYGIICMNGVVQNSNPTTNWEIHLNKVLDFPTEGMRDAFFENFKELIEECKELL